ncbi:hypothetical protein [Pilimelia columellifera]|uniref:Uncharacterized protein n=1 Tax=Pilimelia columellifera subsp. columellifera TaxID=706583 RepID=A0ABP6B0V0_9ACTN
MRGRRAGRLALLAVAGVVAQTAVEALTATPVAPALRRTNFRGRQVTLAGGPAAAIAASAVSAAGAGSRRAAGACLLAGLGSGAVGLYDDVVGNRPEQKAYKGFRGHLAALRERRVSSGMVKILGVGAAAVGAAALVDAGRQRRVVDTALAAGVIAGAANLVNLLDLRPGRALKVTTMLGALMLGGRGGGMAAGPVGAAGGLLRDDLGENIMVGDCGANALGALLGTAFAARTGVLGRAGALAVIASLTLASEKVSFTAVIDHTPALRQLDDLGRRRL